MASNASLHSVLLLLARMPASVRFANKVWRNQDSTNIQVLPWKVLWLVVVFLHYLYVEEQQKNKHFAGNE